MKWVRRVFLTLFIAGLVGLFFIYLINRHIQSVSAAKIETSITEIPIEEPKRVAVVFGARVWDDGTPSNTLYDRVLTAVELYRAGRVRKLLMSGDNPSPEYNEPGAMKKTAMELGIPEQDIILDSAGSRTFDTCFRAREIFEVKKAVLVTQEFHQARALYLCNGLGIDSVGITANRRRYDGERYWTVREFFSVARAWLDMNFMPFEPVKGEKQPIEQ